MTSEELAALLDTTMNRRMDVGEKIEELEESEAPLSPAQHKELMALQQEDFKLMEECTQIARFLF